MYWCVTLNSTARVLFVVSCRERKWSSPDWFFGIWMGKLSRRGLSPCRPDWGEIEWRIWAPRWSWPQPFFNPPPCHSQSSSRLLGEVEENILLTVSTESLQLLSFFIFTHLYFLWFIVPLRSLSGVKRLHFPSLCAHRNTCRSARTCSLTHFSLSSTLCPLLLPLRLLFFSSGWNLGCIGMSPFITPPFVRRIGESVQTWESVCWGVKGPLSPKPSPVHPAESPDGVIQPSWSLANSYSHTDTHTQMHSKRKSQTSSLVS